MRCFNCNEEGHLANECKKPRRERGSCFTCGRMDHVHRDCPARRTSTTSRHPDQRSVPAKPPADSTTTTVMIERPQLSDILDAAPDHRERQCDSGTPAAAPLLQLLNDYCIFISEAKGNQYYVEALIDSGSKFSIMKKSIYETHFEGYDFEDKNDITSYRGVNKSVLIVFGYATLNIRVSELPHEVLRVRFAIVPDSTMSYDALVGEDFIKIPGMRVTLNAKIELNYSEPRNEVLTIDVFEQPSQLDKIKNDFGHDLPLEARDELFESLDDYVNSEV